MMLWTEGRWPMGHLPFLNPVAVQRIHRCPATQGTSPSRGEVTAKGKTKTAERHKVRLGLDSSVIKAKTSLVPTTQAEGRVPAHLHTRGRQHAQNAEAFCPSLTVIPHPMQYSETTQPPFPLALSFRDAALTDGRNAGGGRNASTSGRQTAKSRDRLHTANTLQTIERGCFIDFRENVFHPRTTEKKVEKK